MCDQIKIQTCSTLKSKKSFCKNVAQNNHLKRVPESVNANRLASYTDVMGVQF